MFLTKAVHRRTEMFDIFLTHAWRYHDNWNSFVELLDSVPGFEWRNFSLPWYDPAFDPRTSLGLKMVTRSLEAQITPVHCVIVLSSVFETKSARAWVDREIDIARAHNKHIIGVPELGKDEVPQEVRDVVDQVVPWDGGAVVEMIAGGAR